MNLRQAAFGIGRMIGKHPVASQLFCLVERALPLQRLARSQRVVAFMHPRPSYQPHILVVPTMPFPALTTPNLTNEQKASLLWDMITLARSVADDQHGDWRMVINGGERQDIGQVHGHLIHANGESMDAGWMLSDPEKHLDAWRHLFERVQRAAHTPRNGYSVTFELGPEDRVTATFSESFHP